MNINIKTIPHNEQRYDTVGDWWWAENEDLEIRVSDMKNPKYEFLVALHELVEVMLCKDREITTEMVDAFDKAFEANRKEGDFREAGDSLDAPYQKEHFFATCIERLVACELKVDWIKYDETVNKL